MILQMLEHHLVMKGTSKYKVHYYVILHEDFKLTNEG